MYNIFNSSGSSGIVIFVIFGLLVAFMISIAVFGSFKERNKRRVELSSKKIKNTDAEHFYISSIFKIEIVILEVEQDLENFKPSVGKKTFKEISTHANEIIQAIYKDEGFKDLKKSEKYFPILEEIIKPLLSEKATNWDKNCFVSINICKAKAEAYKEKEKELYKEIKKEMKKTYEK